MDNDRINRIRAFLTNVATATTPIPPSHIQAVTRALDAVYSNQTFDEKNMRDTIHHNKKGFNGRDADFGSGLAEYARSGRVFTEKQAKACAKMLVKYSRQIAEAIPEPAKSNA